MSYHEILNTIIFHRNKILKVTVIGTVLLFLILLFIYPRTYKSSISVMPPESNQEQGSLSSLLSGQDFSSILSGGLSSANSQLYVEMLKSRTAALYVINKYHLTGYYNTDNKYKAAEKLRDHLEIDLTKEGIIKLDVEVSTSILPMITSNSDSIKQFAADLSNSYVEALDKMNREKLSSQAKRARLYIEEQLVKTKNQLDSVENKLAEFQKTNKAISLPEQVNAAIDAAAGLKTEIVKTEVQLGLLQSNLREDNQTLVGLRTKLDQLRGQYNKMAMGSQDYLVAFKDVPELGKELASLLRDVKIQNEVYLLLQQQYYKEKIQENRDIPTIQVLDEAIPAQGKSAPKTVFSTITGGILIFLLMSLIVVLNERKTYWFKSKE
ncbi:MAG TPA: Wzz/FepE/Etk N-terminal domain-containing protein [Ignavibacteriaceae bacterium]|nr:Wzz/FepE/Etk N-terminal domain-containing protein [Ignavibacteriaceae bacterium]